MRHWIEVDGKPQEVGSLEEWWESYEGSDRRVARDSVGDVDVSTVFLGIDHNFRDVGPPILYETMIFGGHRDQRYQERYATREEALEGHARALAIVHDDTKWYNRLNRLFRSFVDNRERNGW